MSKKNKKSALPKRIAGVKVPKALRKSGVAALLASPTTKALVAEAIMAAGAVGAAAKATDNSKVQNLLDHAADRLKGDGKPADPKAASGALAFAVGEAARAFVDALKRHEREHGEVEPQHEPRSWAHDMAAEEDGRREERTAPRSKKKPVSYEAGPL